MNIYWSHVPWQGVPRKLYWPVKVISWEEVDKRKVEVLCKTDYAIIGVSKDQMIPFPGPGQTFDKLKQQGIETLKKKRLFSQLKAFELDIKWALKECISNDTEENVVKNASGKAGESHDETEISGEMDDDTDDTEEENVVKEASGKAGESHDETEISGEMDDDADDTEEENVVKDASGKAGESHDETEISGEMDDDTDDTEEENVVKDASGKDCESHDETDDTEEDLDYHQHEDQAESDEYVDDSDGDSDSSHNWPHLKDLKEIPHQEGANCASRKVQPDASTDNIICDVNFKDICIRKVMYSGTHNSQNKKKSCTCIRM